MGTNKEGERILAINYSNSLKHLQQLIMDLEECAKSIGKKTIFGGDKLDKAKNKLFATLKQSAIGLAADGYLASEDVDIRLVFAAVNDALNDLRLIYVNWPQAFAFWDHWYEEIVSSREASGVASEKSNSNPSKDNVQPIPTSPRIWYSSQYGIGNKKTDLFLFSHEINRTYYPSGYKVLHTYIRNEGQPVPAFVSDQEIEKPTIKRSIAESACPSCGTPCSTKADDMAYFICSKCKQNWRQRL